MSARYLRILADEQVIDPDDVDLAPRDRAHRAERAAGEQVLDAAGCGPGQQPVLLVPAAGMAVKEWPHWRELATALAGRAFVVGEPSVLEAWRGGPALLLPPVSLRLLAAVFAAVGRRGGVVVGPDTGPMRVAAAVGARTVGIFGPTAGRPVRARADRRGPAGPARTARTAARPRSPSRCAGGRRAARSRRGGPACMADVAPGRVLDLVRGRVSVPASSGDQLALGSPGQK